jgi:DNA-binding NarL/FixJ family response regulator
VLGETPEPSIADYRDADHRRRIGDQPAPGSELAYSATDVDDRRDIHVLFVTGRPAALQFMDTSGRQQSPRVVVHRVPLSTAAIWSVPGDIPADAVVIDVADCPDEAVEVCCVLKQQRPDLPVLALLCCARPTLASHVRSMLTLGVTSFLDARSEPPALFDAIGNLGAGGGMYVRLHDRGWMLEMLVETQRTQTPTADHVLRQQQKALVGLVAQGLTNQEIGKIIHLAPSTVHHQLGELCSLLGVANRVALAGWAGAHGYLRHAGSGAD